MKAERHQFFKRTVKRVYVGPIVTADEAAFVLSMCTGAVEIVSWAPKMDTNQNIHNKTLLLDHLTHNSALERLAVRSNEIFGLHNIVDIGTSSTSLLPHAACALLLGQKFANITHFCIISPPEPTKLITMESFSGENVYPADYDALLYMPSLTHVVFGKLWTRPHMILLPFFSRMLSRDLGSAVGSGPSSCLQSLLLISSEAEFIVHLKKWHERDARSDCRLTFGRGYDYHSMAQLGWVHKF